MHMGHTKTFFNRREWHLYNVQDTLNIEYDQNHQQRFSSDVGIEYDVSFSDVLSFQIELLTRL